MNGILVFDAWGKFQSGILSGNIYNFGNFESCLRIHHESEHFGMIEGEFKFYQNKSFTI